MIAGDKTDVLIVVDVQNDFCCREVAFRCRAAAMLVPVINRLAGRFANVVVTQDWAPSTTIFRSLQCIRESNQTTSLPLPMVLRSFGRTIAYRERQGLNFTSRYAFRKP